MKVRGTQEVVDTLEIGTTTVYIRSNVIYIDTEDFLGWEYDEEQLSKDDFIANLQQNNELLRIEQTQTNTTLLELMEVVLIGGI